MADLGDTRLDSELVERPRSGDEGARAMRGRLARILFGEAAGEVRVGRFEVLETIGVGGMGVVYMARDPRLDRRVALKLLHPDAMTNEVERLRLSREAQALAKLSHPNVVQLYEIGDHDGRVFLAMELVEGSSLRDWQVGEARGWHELLDIYLQAGEGLHAAHCAGLVHRDFKPTNVLVGGDGRVRVADFGLARGPGLLSGSARASDSAQRSVAPSENSTITRPGAVLGTPAYMSPEQLRGDPVDARSDQFSFAVALWEALFGARPYAGRNLREVTPDHTDASRPAIPSRAQRVPRAIARILVVSLHPSPAGRFASMSELLQRLRRLPRSLATRRTLGIAAATAAVALSGGLALATGDRCRDAADEIDEMWSAGDRAEVAVRFGAPAFERVGPQVVERVDAHVHEWREAARAVCEANRKLPDDPAWRCLQARSRDLAVLLSHVRAGAPDILVVADDALRQLVPPQRCLQAGTEPGGELLELTGAEELYRDLHEVSLLVLAGRLVDLDARLGPLSHAAEDLASPAFSARLSLLAGGVHRSHARGSESRSAYMDAVREAREARHVELEVEGWMGLAEVSLAEMERRADAAEYLALAEAAAAGLDLPEPTRFRLSRLQASMTAAEGRVEDAVEKLYGLLQDKTLAPSQRITTRIQLANLLAERDPEAAVREYETALDEAVTTVGPAHPLVATARFDLGLDALRRHQVDRAREELGAARDIQAAAFGDDSPRVAAVLTALAELSLQSGELDHANELAVRAWNLQRDGLPLGHSERGSALALLANLEFARGDQHAALDRSLEYERELALSGDAEELAVLRNNIGWHLCDLSRCSEAEPFFAQAAASSEVGSEPWVIGQSGLCRVLTHRQDLQPAIERLQLLLAIAPRRTRRNNELVEGALLFNLARAEILAEDRDAARRHAKEALRHYREHDGPPQRIEELERMLAP